MDEPPPAQNSTTPTTEQPILVLISHSHRRPLSHPPDLKFDLRKVSNPPKHIRDAYDGRSKRLREHLMHMEDFASLLEAAKSSIEEEMKVLTQNSKGEPNHHYIEIDFLAALLSGSEAYRSSMTSKRTRSCPPPSLRREGGRHPGNCGRGCSSACCKLFLRTRQAPQCSIRRRTGTTQMASRLGRSAPPPRRRRGQWEEARPKKERRRISEPTRQCRIWRFRRGLSKPLESTQLPLFPQLNEMRA